MLMIKIIMVVLVGILGFIYQAIKPPPPKICGSLNGPPITSPRIKLSDGRYISYKESGVPKEKAKYKIIFSHGFNDAKDYFLPVSKEIFEELGIYLLTFDRAGYGESDPNPKRSVKSQAFEIQEIADQLKLGSKFYLIGDSLGAYPVYGCLKYIPNRIAGASLIAPIINYNWPSLPSNVSKLAYKNVPLRDQLTHWIAYYVPQLLYWWMTQKWFPMSGMEGFKGNSAIFTDSDLLLLQRILDNPPPFYEKITQQGIYESLCRDIMVGSGKWDFDPLEMKNPFPDENEKKSVVVQMWHGTEDRAVSVHAQRYVAERLPWIKFYEVVDAGHLISHNPTLSNAILRALLIGEQPSFI